MKELLCPKLEQCKPQNKVNYNPKYKISIHLDRYTLLHLKWISSQDLLYGSGDSAQCHVAAWMGGKFGGEWIHVYV